jgi:hypothetical protein
MEITNALWHLRLRYQEYGPLYHTVQFCIVVLFNDTANTWSMRRVDGGELGWKFLWPNAVDVPVFYFMDSTTQEEPLSGHLTPRMNLQRYRYANERRSYRNA